MFTVKQLSKLAGVTPRALHYYDEIGLLKPSQVGDNGYRYYEEEALLRLQQILLYRELDMPLEKIKRILGRPDFDVSSALEGHKAELHKRISRLEKLLNTVDYTITHLKGKEEMAKKQLFAGFSDEQQAAYEKEAEQKWGPEHVQASNKRWKAYSDDEKQRIMEEGNRMYMDLLKAMPRGADSPEVQSCIARWHSHLEYFWSPNDEQLLGLANLYNEDPRFKEFYDKIDLRLAEFMREAVKVYVQGRQK
jgi:MerR family transcriptional regulator, thiopeptide resistance regulator